MASGCGCIEHPPIFPVSSQARLLAGLASPYSPDLYYMYHSSIVFLSLNDRSLPHNIRWRRGNLGSHTGVGLRPTLSRGAFRSISRNQ